MTFKKILVNQLSTLHLPRAASGLSPLFEQSVQASACSFSVVAEALWDACPQEGVMDNYVVQSTFCKKYKAIVTYIPVNLICRLLG